MLDSSSANPGWLALLDALTMDHEVDLVKRLRDYEEELGPQCGAALLGEAADEIEELRHDNEACCASNKALNRKIKKLRSALRAIVEADWDRTRDLDEMLQQIARTALDAEPQSEGQK